MSLPGCASLVDGVSRLNSCQNDLSATTRGSKNPRRSAGSRSRPASFRLTPKHAPGSLKDPAYSDLAIHRGLASSMPWPRTLARPSLSAGQSGPWAYLQSLALLLATWVRINADRVAMASWAWWGVGSCHRNKRRPTSGFGAASRCTGSSVRGNYPPFVWPTSCASICATSRS